MKKIGCKHCLGSTLLSCFFSNKNSEEASQISSKAIMKESGVNLKIINKLIFSDINPVYFSNTYKLIIQVIHMDTAINRV
jgi:hypothetical protein